MYGLISIEYTYAAAPEHSRFVDQASHHCSVCQQHVLDREGIELDSVLPSMAREEWIVLTRLTFLNRNVSPCSKLIAYFSIWPEIFAIRLIALDDTVKGGLYIVIPTVIPTQI